MHSVELAIAKQNSPIIRNRRIEIALRETMQISQQNWNGHNTPWIKY